MMNRNIFHNKHILFFFILLINIFIQAQEAVYARSAYRLQFKEQVEKYLYQNSKRYIEDLPTLETGTVIFRINGKDDWTYETYDASHPVKFPGLE
jgi:membrane-bound ClpP family serine protease